jgi:enoyl-CoA hydratase/carnithine racemase
MTSVTGASRHPNIVVGRDGHVVTVTIDRPESKNGCTGDMWVAIGAVFQDIRYSDARCVVLTGANGAFCSGADLGGAGGGDSAAPSGSMVTAMRVLADVVLSIHSCPIPVVAKVDGLCVGAGLGLALAADLTWCSDRARFSAIFAKRGLSLDFGTSWLLRQRLPVHRAKEMALTAKILSGQEAFDLGLVNAVVPADALDAATAEVVDVIASGPPVALSLTKRELDNASTSSLAHALEMEALAQDVNVHTDDMREALVAWFERRPANFTGR